MDPLVYYKLKATLLENQARRVEFVRLSLLHKRQAIIEAGLDPAVTYTFDDATLTVVPSATIEGHSKNCATEE